MQPKARIFGHFCLARGYGCINRPITRESSRNLTHAYNVLTSNVGFGALRNVDVGHDGVGSPGQADDQPIGEKMNDNN